MTNSKHTKRALLASILSVVVCAAMLAGSTFAWFTDSVTSAGNIIKSGNLDVEMYWAEGTTDPSATTTVWKDASKGPIFNYGLWEPGYTEVRHVKISNVGSLALKYQIHIAATGTVSKLAEVIDVYYIKGGQQIANRAGLANLEPIGTLAEVLANPAVANGHISGKKDDVVSSDIATIALKMQETAGNEYKDLSIGSEFAIKLSATQYTEEIDSFDKDYDKGAWSDLEKQQRLEDLIAEGYAPVDSNNSFTEATAESDKIVVTEDLVVDQNTPVVKGNTTIDFNYGKVTRETANGSGLKVTNYDADVTLQNADFVSVKGGTVVRVEGAKSLTIKNSKFICEAPGSTGNKIFQLTPSEAGKKMTVTFENCVFDTGYVGIEGYNNITEYDVRFVNCKFTWDDKNGSSFVQAGNYAKGNYSFENCTFGYTNWWSGPLVQINNPNEKSNVILQDITVNGSGSRKPYVVSGFSVVGKRNLTVTSNGTNQYVYNSEVLDWETIAVDK